MIEFLYIKDIQTGSTLQVLKPSSDTGYIIAVDKADPIEVRRKSVRKIIRTWMREQRRQTKS